MCGIVGIANLDFNSRPLEKDVRGMMDAIAHRGPDDEGLYINGPVGLGFRRLSIIDVGLGHQPMTNEDGTIWITFNGEIYNYLELRKELLNLGHKFKTNTDTETIVHLYEEHGEHCFRFLRGMFAIVIWDSKKNKLVGGRDRFGIKPFFYQYSDKRFVWGSELKSIAKVSERSFNLNANALDYFFAYGYTPNDQSIYEEVQKLKPANYFVLTYSHNGGVDIEFKQYWHLKAESVEKTELEWQNEINSVLSESINMHLMSDVPLGAFLSGGIDSSSVVALMAQEAGVKIKTFSIGFGDPKINELEYARIIAKKYNTDHHELMVEAPDTEFIEKMIDVYDEPYADTSAIPTLILSEFTRKYVKVALSGDGGDELFAGYKDYLRSYYFNKYNTIPGGVKKALWHTAYRCLSQRSVYKRQFYQLSKKNKYMHSYISIWDEFERKGLFNEDVSCKIDLKAEQIKNNILDGYNCDNLKAAQMLDIQTYMNDCILTKVDRASMNHSLEVRVPLLDHKFVEMAFKIPSELKLVNGKLKYLLKNAMASHLHPDILSHKKQGFTVPMKSWLTNELYDKIHHELLDRKNILYDFLNYDSVKEVVRNNEESKRKLERHVWTIFVFSEWMNSGKANI